MIQKKLFTKMFLVAAMLGVGSMSAWAQTTVTYDFKTYGSKTLTYEGDKVANANSSNFYLPTNLPEASGRFAFAHNDAVSVSSTDGLYLQRTRGDYAAILGLAAGDKVTITFTSGDVLWRSGSTAISVGDWTTYTSGSELTTTAAGNLYFQGKNTCKISSVVIVTSATETMTAPSISSEANGSARTVTITGGSSSLLAPVTTYYTTDGTDPTASSTKYTSPFDVDATCTVKAITISSSSAATASTVTSQVIDLDAVDVPTAAITAVDGINRTVTFSCTTDGASLFYSTDDGANYTAGTSLVISANTNIKVKATKGLASAESDNMAFEAGTEIVLNTPTWTKTGYSAGVSTVTLADNQSGKLLSPASTIKYQINDGAEQTYSAAISVNDGETLKYWSEATGYTNSPEGSLFANAPNSNVVIVSENYVGVVGSNSNLSLADGDGYRKIYYNEGAALVSENLLASNINSGSYYMMYRANGLYPASGWNLAIPNLQAGDYITINGVYGNGAFEINSASNMTADLWNTTAGSKYCYTVNTDGQVTFTMARYGYLQSITIQRASVSVTVSAAGMATYVPTCDLDFSASDIKAYKVKVSAKATATLTQVNNVPAGTPVLLIYDGGKTEDIPVMTGAAAVTDNDLVAGTGAAVATTDGEYTNMILNKIDEKVGFYFAAGQTVAANRAYLHFSTTLAPESSSAPMMMVFADDMQTTGVDDVRSKMADVRGDFFDLQGRKVANPTKGLYIVNGKKAIVK